MESEFKVGEVVCLNTGDTLMTVECILIDNENSSDIYKKLYKSYKDRYQTENIFCECVWFDKESVLHRDCFPESVLSHADIKDEEEKLSIDDFPGLKSIKDYLLSKGWKKVEKEDEKY